MNKIDVLTYLSGYDIKVFERFIGSLNDTGFSGKIYIVVNEKDKTVCEILTQKYLNTIFILDSLPKNTHLNCHRFLFYDTFLKGFKPNSEYLLVCDSRDVLFQKNIELYPFQKDIDIYGFLEGITFLNEPNYNTPWIKNLENILGEPIYDKIKDKKIICCGTTIGKTNAIIQYIEKMSYYIQKYNIKYNLDQGIHNYLLYLNILGKKIVFLENKDNLVNTVGNDVHKINKDGLVLNVNDEISTIVHQYDRFSTEQKKQMSGKYDYTY